MPHDLDLDAARDQAGYDHLKLDGQSYRLLGDVPLGVSRRLQEAAAAALSTKKSALKAGRSEDEAEAEANAVRGETITIDIFARLFHRDDRQAVMGALDEITGEELGQLIKHVAEKKSAGLVPLDGGSPSLQSAGLQQSISSQPSLTPEAANPLTNSQHVEPLHGLPAGFELSHATETTTRNVIASNV